MTINTLAEEFLKNYCERRLRPSTVRGYRVNLHRHVLPAFGDFPADSLTVSDLDFLTELLKGRGLSNRSIVYVHATLRKMINYAIRRGYMDFNPYVRFDLPRINRYKYQVLPESEMRRMLDCVQGTTLEIPVTMALCYGLRRGECLGIIPERDLDPCDMTLHVQRSRSWESGREVVTPCKTEDSDRYILLRPEHFDMLCCTPYDGSFACKLTSNQLENRYKVLLENHDFPNIRFHDLRHSYATLMLKKGVDLKIISDVLGHSDIAITADTYLHPDVSVQKRCLEVF